MKIKAKTFARYKDLIRRPVLEHKKATYQHIYRLHPNERDKSKEVVDDTANDEKILLQEFKEGGPESASDVKKMKALEDNYDKLYLLVSDIYKKHDNLMNDICADVEKPQHQNYHHKTSSRYQ